MSTTRLIIAAVAGTLAASLWIPRAHAKKAAPPKSTICNKTAGKVYVATIDYAGKGHHLTTGWIYLAPGECRVFQSDGFYFRGKHTVTGLDKLGRTGCVTPAKKFNIIIPGYGDRGKATCAKERGTMVSFRYTLRKSNQPINVIR